MCWICWAAICTNSLRCRINQRFVVKGDDLPLLCN